MLMCILSRLTTLMRKVQTSLGYHKVTQCEVNWRAQAVLANILMQPCIWYCRTFNPLTKKPKKPQKQTKPLTSLNVHQTIGTVKENSTCAVCIVFVLQYLSTSQLQSVGGKKKKKKSYSRIKLMLKAPQLQNKYQGT